MYWYFDMSNLRYKYFCILFLRRFWSLFLQETKAFDWKRIVLHKAMLHVMCCLTQITSNGSNSRCAYSNATTNQKRGAGIEADCGCGSKPMSCLSRQHLWATYRMMLKHMRCLKWGSWLCFETHYNDVLTEKPYCIIENRSSMTLD